MERGVLDSFQVLLRQTGPQRCHADEDEQQGRWSEVWNVR